jgi:hypothetical protein
VTRYLLVEDVCRRYGVSRRWVSERTREGNTKARPLPHRVFPHTRRCLFTDADFEAFESDCELERIDLGHGGRLVRPKQNGASA